jgi:hypothetical protein
LVYDPLVLWELGNQVCWGFGAFIDDPHGILGRVLWVNMEPRKHRRKSDQWIAVSQSNISEKASVLPAFENPELQYPNRAHFGIVVARVLDQCRSGGSGSSARWLCGTA